MANDIKLANEQTKSHWETIQQWRIDEGKSYARSRGDALTRMAASGLRVDSAQWKANLADIDASHDKEMKRINESATMGLLKDWVKDMKDFYVKATETTLKQRGGKNADPLPRPNRKPTYRERMRGDDSSTYESRYAAWERMGKKDRMESAMERPPPKSYEEAIERSIASGQAYYEESLEGRELRKSGEANVFTVSGLSEKEFRDLGVEEFLQLQFGLSDETVAANEKAAATSAANAKDAARRRKIDKNRQVSPWWG